MPTLRFECVSLLTFHCLYLSAYAIYSLHEENQTLSYIRKLLLYDIIRLPNYILKLALKHRKDHSSSGFTSILFYLEAI